MHPCVNQKFNDKSLECTGQTIIKIGPSRLLWTLQAHEIGVLAGARPTRYKRTGKKHDLTIILDNEGKIVEKTTRPEVYLLASEQLLLRPKNEGWFVIPKMDFADPNNPTTPSILVAQSETSPQTCGSG